MAKGTRRSRWILGLLVSVSGLFSLVGWHGHMGHGVISAPTPYTVAESGAPLPPK